jgi:hypothetical protein
MSVTSASSAQASAAPSAAFLARRPVWQVSYLSGLAAAHLIAGAVIIPAVAWRLARAR